jgi:hypothetical protein
MLSRARGHALKHFHLDGHFVGCCFIPSAVFSKYCKEYIGRETGQWVFPVDYVNRIYAEWNTCGNLNHAIDRTLNFRTEGDMTLCIYKKPLQTAFQHAHPILPQKDTPGANSQWVPGGYTASGVPEIILPQTHVSNYTITHLRSLRFQ